MMPVTRRIPDGLLERYLADDLQAEAKARLEVTLVGSPEDQARLAELRADSAAFLLQRPPRIVVERFQKERRRSRAWPWIALLIPALVVAVIVLTRPPPNPYTPKGSAFLVMFRKTKDGPIEAVGDAPLAPNDLLLFKITAESGFVAVLSKDAKGTVSTYYPYEGESAAPYDPNYVTLLGNITLDDTLGREDIYLLHSARPFELDWAVQALKEGQPLEDAAPTGVTVWHGFFTKQK